MQLKGWWLLALVLYVSLALQAKAVSVTQPHSLPSKYAMASLSSSRVFEARTSMRNRSTAISNSCFFPQISGRGRQHGRLLEPAQTRRSRWHCCQRSSSASSSRLESGSEQRQQPPRSRRGLWSLNAHCRILTQRVLYYALL